MASAEPAPPTPTSATSTSSQLLAPAQHVSETRKVSLQEREVHRYYQPWLSAHGSSLNVASHVESIAKLDLHGRGYKPKSSRDKALTAFAQLAALRLGVKTAMVSLIDTNSQYILAEATKKSNINSSEDLWLGSTILSRPDAVCEHCFYNSYTAQDENGGKPYTAKGLIVNDCREDDRFKTRPYVVSEPGVRFYAGVPIITRNNIMIGAYAVSDESPRNGLNAEELRFMVETAVAVMEHFEWARDRVDRFKGDRIVRGMAAFIEGCSSLAGAEPGQEEPEQTAGVMQRDFAKPSVRMARRSRSPSGKTSATAAVARKASASPPPASPGGSATRPRFRRQKSAANKANRDSASSMFARAAEILRESTIADGAAIFGASAGASNSRANSMRGVVPSVSSDEGTPTPTGTSKSQNQASMDSSAHDTGTSDSDSSPMARPCKILAFSLADERAKADIEQGSALTLGTLEKYFALYPKGKVFSFTDTGSGLSSEDEGSASERESRQRSGGDGESEVMTAAARRNRRNRIDHRELLKKIPGAKSVVFLPLYDYMEEKLMAGCFLWTSVTGRMMNLDDDLSYLRAFGNSIMSEVARMNVQKNEAAKTTFIASMSHELRSPLHGILGAAEFLVDTATDSYQGGLITSIATCGKTLLDTLNHVLDYSKINKLGRAQMRRNAKQNKLVKLNGDVGLESINMTAEVDLGVLVEEVVEAVTAGHQFKKLHHGSVITYSRDESGAAGANGVASINGVSAGKADLDASAAGEAEGVVSVLLDISPRRSWTVRTQPGALRRIIMNLLGNALKYTSSGFVAVSLRAQENPNSSKVNALIRVVDSGKGMSEEFQVSRLFLPFSQEDSFQPGTGLGLSIVKQIVDSLGGSIEVKSQQGMGTEVDVHVSLIPAGTANQLPQDDIAEQVSRQTQGMKLVLLDPCAAGKPRTLTNQIARLEETVREVCETWFGIRTEKSETMEHADADIYLYSEPPTVDYLLKHHGRERIRTRDGKEKPLIIICHNAEEAVEVSRHKTKALAELGAVVEVIPQPCGPRKLAKVLGHCLRRVDEAVAREMLPGASESLEESEHARLASPRPAEPMRTNASQIVPLSSAVSFPSPPPLDPETPSLGKAVTSVAESHKPAPIIDSSESPLHVLLVDDNKINLQLLTMFMKKSRYTYAEAENGLEALNKYKESVLPGAQTSASNGAEPGRRFDYVLMDISMPVMNGLESTKRIREFEKENKLRGAGVIALTGLASKEAQKEAETAGVDVFLPKPVRFAELKKLLIAR